MRSDKCSNCVEHKRCRDSTASILAFVIGLIAIIAVRVVTILEHIDPLYGKIAWYIGVFGFVIYFAYKFNIDRARSRIVHERKLHDKLVNAGSIHKEDREFISSLLCGITSGKDRFTYLVIFLSSAIVLIIALYLDLKR
jgi:hypothetical protein